MNYDHVSVQYGKIRQIRREYYSGEITTVFEQRVTYTLHGNHTPGTVGYVKDVYTVWIPIDNITETEWDKERSKTPACPKWVMGLNERHSI